MTGGYWILFIAVALISYLVQANLKSKFERFSKIPLPNGMTGRDVAIKMLHDNGIYDVQVISTPGMLTDHYNPMNKTVNLSEGVYGSSIVSWVLLAGMLLMNTFSGLLFLGILLFAVTTLFSFITLPVEIDASRRALVWLNTAGVTNVNTHDKATEALKSAAYTYVVAALSSLATLVYYIMIYMSRRE